MSKACFRERLETVKVQRATGEASPTRSCLPFFDGVLLLGRTESSVFIYMSCRVLVAGPHRHWWGSSGAGFFFRVSMMDWTPRFTLVVTRRVTESEDDGDEQVEDF